MNSNSENIWLHCTLTSSVIPYIQQIPLSTDFRQHVCYIFFLNRCPIFDESSKLTNTEVHGRSKVPRLISTLGRLLCMKQKLTQLLFIIGFEFCGVLSQLRFVATYWPKDTHWTKVITWFAVRLMQYTVRGRFFEIHLVPA